MLPKINRIKKKKDFDLIFKKGKSFKTSLLVLKILKNELNENRVGFIISSKVSKKAVLRNKIRRRLSELFKKEEINLKGFDFIFIGLPGLEKVDYSETKEILQTLLKKNK